MDNLAPSALARPIRAALSNHGMQHDSHARRDRKLADFLRRNTTRLSHRDELMAKAEAKRTRKNAKRCRDAFNSAVGQLRARERLQGTTFA